jgi:hypothetical protein
LGSTKRARDNRRQPWSGAPDCPVCHRTMSGAPPDSVGCTRGLHTKLFTFGKIQKRSAIIHRTVRCTPDSVRCPMGEQLWNSPASGIRSAIIHQTCPVYTGLSGEPAEQRLLRDNGHLQSHLMRAEVRHARSGVPDTLSACPVCHRTSRRAQQSELQRSEPNGLVTWLAHRTLSSGAPDCPVRHATAASTKRLVWWLGL